MSQMKEQEQDQVYASLLEMARANGMSAEEFDSLYKAVSQGASLAEIFNISKDMLESGYTYAYQLYQSGNYADAEKMFRGLSLYCNTDTRFWMGLAGCLQARGDYQNAVDAYSMAGVAGSFSDPAPFYYGGLCYLKMGDRENAIGAFKGALTLGDDSNPDHKACHERIKGLLDSLAQVKE